MEQYGNTGAVPSGTASGAGRGAVVGSGNFLQDNFTKLNAGGGVLVTGNGVIDGDNIDGGGNKAQKTAGTPKCEIDGNPCLP